MNGPTWFEVNVTRQTHGTPERLFKPSWVSLIEFWVVNFGRSAAEIFVTCWGFDQRLIDIIRVLAILSVKFFTLRPLVAANIQYFTFVTSSSCYLFLFLPLRVTIAVWASTLLNRLLRSSKPRYTSSQMNSSVYVVFRGSHPIRQTNSLQKSFELQGILPSRGFA